MIGDEGPYLNGQGDIWVPRTVPYLEARRIAKVEAERVAYLGKSDAALLGFMRDCRCDEVCEREHDEDGAWTGPGPCRVPAWHFADVEDRA